MIKNLWQKTCFWRRGWTWAERVFCCVVKTFNFLRQSLSKINSRSLNLIFLGVILLINGWYWTIVLQLHHMKRWCPRKETEMRRSIFLAKVSNLAFFIPEIRKNGQLSHFKRKSDALSIKRALISLDTRTCAESTAFEFRPENKHSPVHLQRYKACV